MLRIKKAEDIDLDDLPKIELPFFAKSSVERAFSGVQGFDSIWGLDEVLRDISPGIYPTGRNKYQLAQLLDMIEKGRIFLLKDNYSSFNKIMWYILVKSGESKCYVYSTKKPDLLVENLDSYYIQKRKTNKFSASFIFWFTLFRSFRKIATDMKSPEIRGYISLLFFWIPAAFLRQLSGPF